jgi:tyrosine-protein kinase Etk/Wzc
VSENSHNVELQDDRAEASGLRNLLGLVIDEWPWVAGITLAVVCLTSLYALTITPVFRADALVQVEQHSSGIGGLDDLATAFGGGDTSTAAEVEIVRSRMVLSETVEQQNLHVRAAPVRFPWIGDAIARRHSGEQVAGAWLGLESYGWGGERIRVDRLEVDRHLEGQELTLIAGAASTYTVF